MEEWKDKRLKISYRDLVCIAHMLRSSHKNEGNPFCECDNCEFKCHVFDGDKAVVMAPNADVIWGQLFLVTGIVFQGVLQNDEKRSQLEVADFSNQEDRDEILGRYDLKGD